jgi:hypothetical protein
MDPIFGRMVQGTEDAPATCAVAWSVDEFNQFL